MSKFTIKVTYCDETKRVQAPKTYAELFASVTVSFKLGGSSEQPVDQLRFYLLDEEQELISIASQEDFQDNVDYLQQGQGAAGSQSAVPSLIFSNSPQAAQDQLRSLKASRAPLADSMISAQSSRMMQALGNKLQSQVQQKLEEKQVLVDEDKLRSMVDEAVKREVQVYCAEYLPGMIREQLEAMRLAPSQNKKQQVQEEAEEEEPLLKVEVGRIKSAVEEQEVSEASEDADVFADAREKQPVAEKENPVDYSDAVVADPIQEEEEKKGVSDSEEKVVYSAKLLASDAPKQSYRPGSSFMRHFTMSNRGKVCWPKSVSLVKVSGDEDLQVLPSVISNVEKVDCGETYTFEVICIAPKREGQAQAVLSLMSGEERFGEEIPCLINMMSGEEEERQLSASMLLLADKDKSINFPVGSLEADDDDSSSGGQVGEKQDVLLSGGIQDIRAEPVSPRSRYAAMIESSGASEKMRDGLNTLFELGYTDYKINDTLLTRYEGDSNAAAEHLIVHGSGGILPQ